MVPLAASHPVALGSLTMVQLQEGVIAADTLLIPLAAALGLALLVERIVELGKNVLGLVPTAAPGRARRKPGTLGAALDDLVGRHADAEERQQEELAEPDRTARVARLRELEARLERANGHAEREAIEHDVEALRSELREGEAAGELEERLPASTILVRDATDPDNGRVLRAFMIQMIALAAGILAARFTELHLFSALLGREIGDGADYLLTGLLLGGGSAPVHLLIRFVSERRFAAPSRAPAEAEDAETPAPVAPAAAESVAATRIEAPAMVTAPAADDWVEILYDGGVDRDRLQTLHRRRSNPDLIIYHHTAMHGDSAFDDVVRVIKSRKDSKGRPWVTGYNCVVTGDGAIHAFCRWDRYGNHAAGNNMRSLGITLNGNFETNPAVPFSNPDGRFGRQRPSTAQLEAGARVVALWCLVYNIPADFEKTIIPHNAVSTKTCPGNNFPYEDFERLTLHFHDTWRDSARVRARILAFRSKSFVLVDPIADAQIGVEPVPAGAIDREEG